MAVCPSSIKIDLSRNELFDTFALDTLRDSYMVPEDATPQSAFARACAAFADDTAHAQRLYDYVSNLWFMFATPLLSNGGTKRGLPISCFLNWVGDSRKEITDHYTENAFLASMGGGIGSYWGELRANGERTSKGSKSTGVIPFVQIVDREMLAFNQGDTRRGAAAVYLPINHPEVEEWIGMRRESGGDPHRKTLNLHNGLCVSNEFMRAVKNDTDFNLIDPHTKCVKKVISARHLWRVILDVRLETGEPYLFFQDTAQAALPQVLKDIGLQIYASNLCTEITLPTGPDPRDGLMRTAVCCLSSVNLALFDKWKSHPLFIEDLMRMLDNALTVFIETAPPEHAAAVRSAERERSVGLGAMGFHTYLQERMIPFGSAQSKHINKMLFSHIQQKCKAANLELGEERGSPMDLRGTGLRFAHTNAIAPNASSSIFCGNVSPGIEPISHNAVLRKTLSGSFPVKNRQLETLLESKHLNTTETWKSILENGASVQHLSELTTEEKQVFFTASEIDQMHIIELAADRQPMIDQSQSINLFFHKDTTAKELHKVHMAAWSMGLKSLYYLRSKATKRANLISLSTTRVQVDVTVTTNESEPLSVCLACEG